MGLGMWWINPIFQFATEELLVMYGKMTWRSFTCIKVSGYGIELNFTVYF
jgi:hypothetical protein